MTAQIIQFPTKRTTTATRDQCYLRSVYEKAREIRDQRLDTVSVTDWNKIMHLRAHGWTVTQDDLGYYQCSYSDSNVWFELFDAWKIQKLDELSRKYWGKS